MKWYKIVEEKGGEELKKGEDWEKNKGSTTWSSAATEIKFDIGFDVLLRDIVLTDILLREVHSSDVL